MFVMIQWGLVTERHMLLPSLQIPQWWSFSLKLYNLPALWPNRGTLAWRMLHAKTPISYIASVAAPVASNT